MGKKKLIGSSQVSKTRVGREERIKTKRYNVGANSCVLDHSEPYT